MTRFVEGTDRGQSTLFPAVLDDYVGEDNPVRAIDAFVDGLDLAKLGFDGVAALATGRPAYHPATLLKIYVYGYLNRVQSSRRLERECQRNVELVWLTGRLMPYFKTIADFRKDNGEAIRKVCRAFVLLCRRLDLLGDASVAIDGSKFKAVNARDRNFTEGKMKRRLCATRICGHWAGFLQCGAGLRAAPCRRDGAKGQLCSRNRGRGATADTRPIRSRLRDLGNPLLAAGYEG